MRRIVYHFAMVTGSRRWKSPGVDVAKAVAALRRRDPALARVIAEVGPFAMESYPHFTAFQFLLRSIIHQQLSGRAAAAIEGRVWGLFGARGPGPGRLLKLDDAALREAGLSNAKVRSARDLAERARSRELPGRARLAGMDAESIVEQLTRVRGIGPWTVEVMMIFHLERPDVLPATDLGIRKGLMVVQERDDVPSASEVREAGERWRPFRSIASWYLWRASERA